MLCEVCERADTETEAILMPSDVLALMALAYRHSGELEAWPSVWVCDACAEATRPVFRALGHLEPEQLITLTSATLRDLCRLATTSSALAAFIAAADRE